VHRTIHHPWFLLFVDCEAICHAAGPLPTGFWCPRPGSVRGGNFRNAGKVPALPGTPGLRLRGRFHDRWFAGMLAVHSPIPRRDSQCHHNGATGAAPHRHEAEARRFGRRRGVTRHYECRPGDGVWSWGCNHRAAELTTETLRSFETINHRGTEYT